MTHAVTQHAASAPTQQAASRTRQDDATLIPPVDVYEDRGGITLYADMPGVPKDKLSLELEADTLTIAGDVDIELPEGMDATHAEICLPRYRRKFSLSRELDTEKVEAEFTHGVLKLRIPKAEHAQPRKISIELA